MQIDCSIRIVRKNVRSDQEAIPVADNEIDALAPAVVDVKSLVPCSVQVAGFHDGRRDCSGIGRQEEHAHHVFNL